MTMCSFCDIVSQKCKNYKIYLDSLHGTFMRNEIFYNVPKFRGKVNLC